MEALFKAALGLADPWYVKALDFSKEEKRLEKLHRTPEWAFYREVFCRIDEGMFEVLYSDKPSRPNSPVNQILGAVILKEMKKWTWQELEDHLELDLNRSTLSLKNEKTFCS